MKLIKINFAAFGPFTEKTLAFTPDDNGLHIIYGPNEAGKSSSLRGLKALLYGFKKRSTDDFIHKSAKLRIEGVLQAFNGETIAFKRRKGNKETLLSMDEKALKDNVLDPFLEGVQEELFDTIFGIDHQTLNRGGQDIFEQKGDTGQALFSASMGNTTLHTVIEQLKKEADALFTPSGSTRAINVELRKYKDLTTKVKNESLSSVKWDTHRKTLNKTQKELKRVETELNDKRMKATQLERIKRVLPKLTQRQELLKKLDNLADTVILSSDFKERRQKAIAEKDTAEALRDKALSQLKSMQENCDNLNIRESILKYADTIENLHIRLEYYHRAKKDEPQDQAEYNLLKASIKSLLAEIRPDVALSEIEDLRPILAKKSRITALGNQHSKLDTLANKSHSELTKIQVRLTNKRKQLKGLPSPGSANDLTLAVSSANKLGDIDNSITTQQKALKTLTADCDIDLKKLTLWSGSLDGVDILPVPSSESIHRFDKEFTSLNQKKMRLNEKQIELKSLLQDCSQQLDEMTFSGEVPTEKELHSLRDKREQAWKLLKRQWIDGDDIKKEATEFDKKYSLPEAFERRVKNADDIADRLRREDKRVHTQASLQAELNSINEQIEANNQDTSNCSKKIEILSIEWKDLWSACELTPLPPREMEAWLNKLESLDVKLSQLRTLKYNLNGALESRDKNISDLQQHLGALRQTATSTSNLSIILEQCQSYLSDIEQNNQQHKLLSREIGTLESDQQDINTENKKANDALSSWSIEWNKAIKGIANENSMLPNEAIYTLEKLTILFEKYDKSTEAKTEIELKNNEMRSFNDDVRDLTGKAATELSEIPTVDAATRLNALLLENRTHSTRKNQLLEQISQADKDVHDASATIQTMLDRLTKLCIEAKCTDPTNLVRAEQKSQEHTSLKLEINQIEDSLIKEGLSLIDLEMECKDIDYDTLPGKINAITTDIKDTVEPKSLELGISIGREQKEMELMDGSDNAAVLADEGQSILAEIQSNAEQYIRLKLAHKILNDEVERYKNENQNPLIQRASEYFSKLTQGSFNGIITGYNNKDESILLGVRDDESQVNVEGMSNGTLDQLYLSLRLATLEQHMEKSAPMPFIVDDILVDFDDNRTEAALQALAEFAKSTQVIMFTHHSRIVEQAENLKGRKNVYLHTL